MADVASSLRSWSAIEGNNSPSGLTLIGANLDDNLRTIQAVVRRYYSSVASNMTAGSTVDLSTADGYYVTITGTTTITSFGTESAGISYLLKFASNLTLTHNATSLICPGGANIYTKANDVCLVISEGSGNWRVVNYQRYRQVGDVYLADFGKLGVGNDATIFQAAIDFVKGTINTLVIEPNTTVALGTTGVTVSAGVTIRGSNRDRCFITWTGTTMTAITVTTPDSCQFENLYFAGPNSCTAGGAISLSGSGGVANSFSKINNCRFSKGWNQVYAPDAYAWEITGNYFSGAVNAGVYFGNTTAVDDGDSTIERNVFSNLGASASSVYQTSSGGLRLLNNKMNGGLYGYFLALDASAVTSILLITGNSIENQTHSGIVLNNSAGSGGFSQVTIMGNQFGYQPYPINCLDPDTFNTTMVIMANVIVCGSAATTVAAITVTATPKCIVSHNVISGSGSTVEGILIGSSSTDCQVQGNVITGCATNINYGGSSAVVASASSITLSTAIDTFTITGTTSITSISAASAAKGRTVTLMFQSALTFTDGSNLKLAGNFVTTADDTITLCCVDGTNWYEIARSTN